MNNVLILKSCGFVSNVQSLQLNGLSLTSTVQSLQLNGLSLASTVQSLQLSNIGIGVKKVEDSEMIVQVNYI